MRPHLLTALVVLALLAGCGQKGPLVRRSRATAAVVIRTPPTGAATPATPATPPAPRQPGDDQDPPAPRP